MIDEKLYCETFSRLRASDEAKKEVLVKMSEMNGKKTLRRPLKALRRMTRATSCLSPASTRTPNSGTASWC